MSNLVWTPKFIKSYKKVIKRNPNLKSKIIKVFEINTEVNEILIILFNIGTHDEVY
jgi:mRNA-degrading endonuclease YafQ of YafQ-DinJ toxin-antitoxin module